jgi:hypothetical protein
MSASSASIASCSRSPSVSSVTLGADAGGQHHHAHDALGIDAAFAAADPDFAGEAAGQLGQLGRGARVQAQLIADGRGRLDHGCVGLVLRRGDGHLHHALRAADHGAGHQRVERLVAVAHAAQQHRQVHAGDQARLHAVDQLLGHVAGRGAEDVGQHQHALDVRC